MSTKRFTLSVVSLLVLAGATSGAEKKLPPWEKPLHVGRYLYLENCSVCHEINKAETNKLGPTLFRLFQNEKLPFSGGKPSEPICSHQDPIRRRRHAAFCQQTH